MSLLNSKFDIVSVDQPVAVAALAQVLSVASPPSPAFNANGTPVAGSIVPGTIVMMDSTGKAVAASSADVVASRLDTVAPFVVIDGNADFSGAFTQRLTVLQGGFTMVTDQWTSADPATDFAKGKFVSFDAGKIVAATATNQWLGVVGPDGYSAAEGTVQVIVPQGGF